MTWHYSYSGNDSLVLVTHGESVGNGAKRYTHNAAGYLVTVENYSTAWQPQAQMSYAGPGNRLEMTGYASPLYPRGGWAKCDHAV